MAALRWLAIAVAALGLAAALACYAQRWLLFPAAARDGSGFELAADAERVWLDAGGDRVEAFLLASTAQRKEPGPLLLFAHGNGELIDDWARAFDAPRAAGASVLLVEYPGYGRSSGTPSERSITRTFVSAYDWATSRPQVDPQRIVGYGRSLGGGAICALSRERDLAAMVLESTFTSVRDAAALLHVPGFLVRDPFDNLAAVSGFRGPILVLHGQWDASIPVEHARRLHAARPGSELHVLPCGHNDCPRPWSTLSAFLSKHHLL